MRRRALELTGEVARHIPLDRAQLFSFIASSRVRSRPWALYQRFHARSPVLPGPMRTWIVASHHGVSTVLRHPNTTVDETRAVGMEDLDRSGSFSTVINRTLLFTDPPDHHRLRRLVSHSFTPARIAALEQPVRQLADDLLADLRPRGSGELIADFALPFPLAVISELLGTPAEDQARFAGWARDLAPRLDVDLFRDEQVERRGDQAAEELAGYLDDLIESRDRLDPGGLIAGLATVHRDEERLDRDEIVSLCVLLLVAGFETTTNLIANSIEALVRHPDQLDLLRRGQVPLDRAVEELLRYAGPVQFTQRVLLEDLELDGQTIPAGTLVALLIGAANRDPAVFDEPDQLRLDRDPNPHLSFSFGIHHCLGAALARLEAAVAIPALLDTLPNLRVVGRPRWRKTFVLRGLTELPVRWDPERS